MHRTALLALLLAVLFFVAVTPAATRVSAVSRRTSSDLAAGSATVPVAALSASDLVVAAVTNLVARSTLGLTASVEKVAVASGGTVGITLVELGGSNPVAWSFNGSTVLTAASTYKLAALMMEAEEIAAGKIDPNGLVCFEPDDYESGWFDDYSPGVCFTRNELAARAGKVSDNTAGHMLVRDLGGADALNAWAASVGATSSAFFVDNTTTSNDLGALWAAEAKGKLGGVAAQAWLYPLLTGTSTEAGVPVGVGTATAVVHKTGAVDQVENDAALIASGPDGPYVLTVMTDGIGGDGGWQLIASISSRVWKFETLRTQ